MIDSYKVTRACCIYGVAAEIQISVVVSVTLCDYDLLTCHSGIRLATLTAHLYSLKKWVQHSNTVIKQYVKTS
jgi:hypothetical protein